MSTADREDCSERAILFVARLRFAQIEMFICVCERVTVSLLVGVRRTLRFRGAEEHVFATRSSAMIGANVAQHIFAGVSLA